MAKCSGITRSGERCKGVAIDGSGLCYSHSPDYADARRRSASKGGKRGGRGRPLVELRNLEGKLDVLAEDVLAGRVDKGVGAVVSQIHNTQIRVISVALKARESEELEERLAEIESVLGQKGQRWG